MLRFDSLTMCLLPNGTALEPCSAAHADPALALDWGAASVATTPPKTSTSESAERPSQRRVRLARVASSFLLVPCDDAPLPQEGGEADDDLEPLSQMSLTQDCGDDDCGDGADTPPPPFADDDNEVSSMGPGSPLPLLPSRERCIFDVEGQEAEVQDDCPASQEPFSLQDHVIATQDYDRADSSQEPVGAPAHAKLGSVFGVVQHLGPLSTAEEGLAATPPRKRQAIAQVDLGYQGKRTACPVTEAATTPDGVRRSTRARTVVQPEYQESDEDSDGEPASRKRPRSDEGEAEMLIRSQGARDSRNWWFDERTRLQALCRDTGVEDGELQAALSGFRLGAQNETLLRYIHVCIKEGVIVESVFTRSKLSAFGLTSFRVAPERSETFFQGLAHLFRLDPSDWMAASGRARKTLLTGLTRFGIKPAAGNANKWLAAYQGAVPFVAVKARKVVLASHPVA